MQHLMVETFLFDELDVIDGFDHLDENPFRNAWHNGSWREEAYDILLQKRKEYGVSLEGVEAFLDRVGSLAADLGYGDGCPKSEVD